MKFDHEKDSKEREREREGELRMRCACAMYRNDVIYGMRYVQVVLLDCYFDR